MLYYVLCIEWHVAFGLHDVGCVVSGVCCVMHVVC